MSELTGEFPRGDPREALSNYLADIRGGNSGKEISEKRALEELVQLVGQHIRPDQQSSVSQSLRKLMVGLPSIPFVPAGSRDQFVKDNIPLISNLLCTVDSPFRNRAFNKYPDNSINFSPKECLTDFAAPIANAAYQHYEGIDAKDKRILQALYTDMSNDPFLKNILLNNPGYINLGEVFHRLKQIGYQQEKIGPYALQEAIASYVQSIGFSARRKITQECVVGFVGPPYVEQVSKYFDYGPKYEDDPKYKADVETIKQAWPFKPNELRVIGPASYHKTSVIFVERVINPNKRITYVARPVDSDSLGKYRAVQLAEKTAGTKYLPSMVLGKEHSPKMAFAEYIHGVTLGEYLAKSEWTGTPVIPMEIPMQLAHLQLITSQAGLAGIDGSDYGGYTDDIVIDPDKQTLKLADLRGHIKATAKDHLSHSVGFSLLARLLVAAHSPKPRSGREYLELYKRSWEDFPRTISDEGYQVGKIVQSPEFEQLPMHVRYFILDALGLFTGSDQNPWSTAGYQKRLTAILSLAKQKGLSMAKIPDLLKPQFSSVPVASAEKMHYSSKDLVPFPLFSPKDVKKIGEKGNTDYGSEISKRLFEGKTHSLPGLFYENAIVTPFSPFTSGESATSTIQTPPLRFTDDQFNAFFSTIEQVGLNQHIGTLYDLYDSIHRDKISRAELNGENFRKAVINKWALETLLQWRIFRIRGELNSRQNSFSPELRFKLASGEAGKMLIETADDVMYREIEFDREAIAEVKTMIDNLAKNIGTQGPVSLSQDDETTIERILEILQRDMNVFDEYKMDSPEQAIEALKSALTAGELYEDESKKPDLGVLGMPLERIGDTKISIPEQHYREARAEFTAAFGDKEFDHYARLAAQAIEHGLTLRFYDPKQISMFPESPAHANFFLAVSFTPEFANGINRTALEVHAGELFRKGVQWIYLADHPQAAAERAKISPEAVGRVDSAAREKLLNIIPQMILQAYGGQRNGALSALAQYKEPKDLLNDAVRKPTIPLSKGDMIAVNSKIDNAQGRALTPAGIHFVKAENITGPNGASIALHEMWHLIQSLIIHKLKINIELSEQLSKKVTEGFTRLVQLEAMAEDLGIDPEAEIAKAGIISSYSLDGLDTKEAAIVATKLRPFLTQKLNDREFGQVWARAKLGDLEGIASALGGWKNFENLLTVWQI